MSLTEATPLTPSNKAGSNGGSVEGSMEKGRAEPDREEAAEGEAGPSFSSQIGLICTCVGCAVGTGNIWRFPRLVATNSGEQGALCFLIVWACFLFLWSIPMLLIEYALGRYTRKGVIQSFQQFLGLKYTWCALWITLVNFTISCYYMVILGWCLYYAYHTIAYPLPTSYQEGNEIFTDFAEESAWPVLTQAIAVLATAAILIKSVKTIERANLFLAPTLIFLLFFIFIWSLTRSGAGNGLRFMFTPDWATLKQPLLWVDAASQNAFDTGAGTGIFVAYAAYMAKDTTIVKYSLLIPLANNVVSLVSGMLIFSTVFSQARQQDPNITDSEILTLLQESGPGSTGLTFVWLPVLLSSAGGFGRAIAVLFFFCLCCAALSSAIAMMEMPAHSFDDFGVPRLGSVGVTALATFIVGLGSALNLEYLTNQDFTWGLGLLINGLFLQFLVIKYGTKHYRENIVNAYNTGKDWNINIVWDIIIKFVAPTEGVALLLWWILDQIIWPAPDAEPWYGISTESLMTVIIQWVASLIILIAVNFALLWWKPTWFMREGLQAQSEKLKETSLSTSSIAGDT